jgi:hypothetical protein
MKFTNKTGLPEIYIKALQASDKNNPYSGYQPGSISVSTLTAPPKTVVLKSQHGDKITEDALDSVWRVFGTSVHSFFEDGIETEPGDIQEERLQTTVNDQVITGQVDYYSASEKCIYDFKTTSVWSAIMGGRADEWAEKMNVYKRILGDNGHKVESLKIVAFYRDWSEAASKRQANYPDSPVQVIDLDVWQDATTHNFIAARLAMLAAAKKELPDCTAKDTWAKPEKWAVYKNSNKTATKVCDTAQDAQDYIRKQDTKHKWSIQHRPGEAVRCGRYCDVAEWCDQYQQSLELMH